MKKFFSLLAMAFAGVSAMAQAPALMQYSCVVKNASDEVVANKKVSGVVFLGYDMAQSTSVSELTAASSYAEKFEANTDENGSMSIVIGQGTGVYGSMEAAAAKMVEKADGKMTISVIIDPNGGENYTVAGQSYMLSVPYAMSAGVAQRAMSVDAIPGLTSNVKVTYKVQGSYNLKDFPMYINGERVESGSSINLPMYQESYLWVETFSTLNVYVDVDDAKAEGTTHVDKKEINGKECKMIKIGPFIGGAKEISVLLAPQVF